MEQTLTLSGGAKGEPCQLLRQLSPIAPRAGSLLTPCAWLVTFPATPLRKGRDPVLSIFSTLQYFAQSMAHGEDQDLFFDLLDSRAESLSDLLISSVWHSALCTEC